MRKKILLLVTAILVQCGVVMGQIPIETAVISDPSGEECGIVRSWKSSLAVAYHQHNGIHLFSVIDSATNTVYSTRVLTTAPIGSYTINDFRIVGDTAFCGGSVDNVAMIAYFNINDITSGYSVGFFILAIEGIEQVTRLAAYRNSVMNGVGIAAIGKNLNMIYPGYDYYFMIECNNSIVRK